MHEKILSRVHPVHSPWKSREKILGKILGKTWDDSEDAVSSVAYSMHDGDPMGNWRKGFDDGVQRNGSLAMIEMSSSSSLSSSLSMWESVTLEEAALDQMAQGPFRYHDAPPNAHDSCLRESHAYGNRDATIGRTIGRTIACFVWESWMVSQWKELPFETIASTRKETRKRMKKRMKKRMRS